MGAQALPIEFAHRISLERKRLGKKQKMIAELCGLSREMWGRYERGTHAMPGNVLRSFIDQGADGLFLRTGVRLEAVNKPTPTQEDTVSGLDVTGSKVQVELASDEYALVLAYRTATSEWRQVFFDLVHAQKRRLTG